MHLDSYIPSNGYPRVKTKKDGEWVSIEEHILVWEQHNGKIPKGMVIHHKDLNKYNNNILNLELVTELYHNRIHRGYIFENNNWYVICKVCNKKLLLSSSNFYITSTGAADHKTCKNCYSLR